MPKADVVKNADISKIPYGGDSMADTTSTNCNCQDTANTGYAPYPGYWCPPPPNCPPPYPYPAPVGTSVGSTEAQIAKLSKKSATIRKMIDSLVNKNKSIIISVGPGASYNFGTYLNSESEETDYGKSVLEILQAELEAIKAKIVELTAELEVEDSTTGEIESTVTTV